MAIYNYNLEEKSVTFLFVVSAVLIMILCGNQIRAVTSQKDCEDRAAMLTRVQDVSFSCGLVLVGKLQESYNCCSGMRNIDFNCLCGAPGLNDSTYAFLRETFRMTAPLTTAICGGVSVLPESCLAGNTAAIPKTAPESPQAGSSKTTKPEPPSNTPSAANGPSASPAKSSKTTNTSSDSHTPSGADTSQCSTTLMSLFPCLDYVKGNSSSSTPSSSCCSQLSIVVQSQPQCLCLLLNGDASAYGINNINQTLALSLPGACNVQNPPVSECDAANGPSPSAAAPESPLTGSSNTTKSSSSIAPSATNGPSVSPATPETPPIDSSNITKPPSSDTPSAESDCTTTLMGLSPCLDYVSGNSSTPSLSCCSELSNVVQSRPRCLCLLVNGAASSYGININQTLALALPSACNVQTPHASKCDSANEPSASPESPPVDPPSGANGPSASPVKPEGAPIDSSNTTKPSSSGTPSAQSDCTNTLMGLSPCLNYVTGNSSTPSASCCSQLSNVVKSQPRCLCLLMNGSASSYGINVNQTLALGLPGVCKVETPPVSRCNSANGPSATPESPTDSSTSTNPSVRIGPSENGANIDRSNIVAVFVVFISSCALSIPTF